MTQISCSLDKVKCNILLGNYFLKLWAFNSCQFFFPVYNAIRKLLSIFEALTDAIFFPAYNNLPLCLSLEIIASFTDDVNNEQTFPIP